MQLICTKLSTHQLGTALGMWLQGFLLTFYHYNPNGITNEALVGIGNMGIYIPAVLCGVSIIFILRYSLTEEKMNRLQKMKQESNSGREIDV
ncbi:hypothetical protein ACQKNS_26765 [Peribacillus sp. NPDC094092]|uniref:hypothetical protein n=1 Tax=Peribacillus sp. NPDC094092 TaxID=3390611 RepID=UPI003D0775FC